MNTHHFKSLKSGFTLVELLVVIFIIGLLSAIIFPGFAGMREKARDTERMTDVRQIQNALEQYFNRHGEYPGSLSGMPSEVPTTDPMGDDYEYSLAGVSLCNGVDAVLYSLSFTAENPGTFHGDSTVVVSGDKVCVDVRSI
jgi:prepilin-type N-terminal cleavage/methylation domain-containing protein